MNNHESNIAGISLIELSVARKSTLSNIASICIECAPGGYDLYDAEQINFEKQVITDEIDSEMNKAASIGPSRCISLLRSYVAAHRYEKGRLKRTQILLEKTGETDENIRHFQTLLTNSIIGFTDPLE